MGPFQKEIVEEIAPNETAFMIPLEGDAKGGQEKFQSEQYLDERKVASKRVSIPTRKIVTGRTWGSYEWIPTAKLIKIDRAPQTRSWTLPDSKNPSDDAIHVESLDSVGFGVGINCTAAVEEEDAAKFLYNYAGKPLAQVMDSDLRGWIQAYTSTQFGRLTLAQCQAQKGDIFTSCSLAAKSFFKPFGITIRNLGYSDGMSYENATIQKRIDEAFAAELEKKMAEQDRQAQTVKNQKERELAENAVQVQTLQNQKELSVAQNKRSMAEEFAKQSEAQTQIIDLEVKKIQAQAMATAAEKWQGGVPSMVIMGQQPSGGVQMPLVMPIGPVKP